MRMPHLMRVQHAAPICTMATRLALASARAAVCMQTANKCTSTGRVSMTASGGSFLSGSLSLLGCKNNKSWTSRTLGALCGLGTKPFGNQTSCMRALHSKVLAPSALQFRSPLLGPSAKVVAGTSPFVSAIRYRGFPKTYPVRSKKKKPNAPRKLKTHAGCKKRFRLRADGKYTYGHIGKKHLMAGTSRSRVLMRKKGTNIAFKGLAKVLRKLMPYGTR